MQFLFTNPSYPLYIYELEDSPGYFSVYPVSSLVFTCLDYRWSLCCRITGRYVKDSNPDEFCFVNCDNENLGGYIKNEL